MAPLTAPVLGAVLAIVASAQGVLVTSDGTAARPYCSWLSTCSWTAATQLECAQAICRASGYTTGTFTSSSGNPCSVSFVSGSRYFYIMDRDTIEYRDLILDARVTADCTGGSSGTPAPTPSGSGTLVTSAGTITRPYCSWSGSCTWTSADQAECARELCKASGYTTGTFVRSSGNPCTDQYTGVSHYSWLLDLERIQYGSWIREAHITAMCYGTAPTAAPTKAPTAMPTPTGGVTITSTGSATRPYCSWSGSCTWGPADQAECAEELCKAAGYDSGVFVTSSGNPCTDQYTGVSHYSWLLDLERIQYGSWIREAHITARCFGDAPTPAPTKAPTMFPTPAGTTVVTSDGSATRPYCSWSGSCTWTTADQAECAEELCKAAGYATGTFAASSGNPCTDQYTGVAHYSWLLDLERIQFGSWIREAHITAFCSGSAPTAAPTKAPTGVPTPDSFDTVTSDGSATRPYCSWSGSCTWTTADQAECASELCKAAGYTGGIFSASSGNPCTDQYTGAPHYSWLLDLERIQYGSWIREAHITALCWPATATGSPTSSVTMAPTDAVTMAPTDAVTMAPTDAVTMAPTDAVTMAPSMPPTMGTTAAPTTAPPSALSDETGCPRICGTPSGGGGTCANRSTGLVCTSCDRTRLRLRGTCVQSAFCRGFKVISGKLLGQSCSCTDANCHYCVRRPTGDTCRTCRNGYYLINGTCVKECPATTTSAGFQPFARKCLDAFECKGGVIRAEQSYPFGCACPNQFNNGSDINCFICDFEIGGFGQKCTRCRNRKFLYEGRCRENCDDAPADFVSYDATAYGAECRPAFNCTSLKDEAGVKCRCPATLGTCQKCEWAATGNRCITCQGGKYLYQGKCRRACPSGTTAVGSGSTGRECVTGLIPE